MGVKTDDQDTMNKVVNAIAPNKSVATMLRNLLEPQARALIQKEIDARNAVPGGANLSSYAVATASSIAVLSAAIKMLGLSTGLSWLAKGAVAAAPAVGAGGAAVVGGASAGGVLTVGGVVASVAALLGITHVVGQAVQPEKTAAQRAYEDEHGHGDGPAAVAAALKPPVVNNENKIDVNVTLDGKAIAAAVESRITNNNRTVNGTGGMDTGAHWAPPDMGAR